MIMQVDRCGYGVDLSTDALSLEPEIRARLWFLGVCASVTQRSAARWATSISKIGAARSYVSLSRPRSIRPCRWLSNERCSIDGLSFLRRLDMCAGSCRRTCHRNCPPQGNNDESE